MTAFVERFFGPENDLDLISLGDDALDRLKPWLDRWEKGQGPAFLPRRIGQELHWYGLTEGGAQRREIEELLEHWLGPSCSDIYEHKGTLRRDDPFDRWLESALPGRVVRLEVWPRRDASKRELVRRRLEKLVELLDARPDRASSGGRTVAEVLDELDLAAAAGDRETAESLLELLGRERLLDEANRLFVRVRMLGTLEDHRALLHRDLVLRLSRLRVPSGVVRTIARAAYTIHLAAPDQERDPVGLREAVERLPERLSDVVRQGPIDGGRALLVTRVALLRGSEPMIRQVRSRVDKGDVHLLEVLAEESATGIEATDGDTRRSSVAIRADELDATTSESVRDRDVLSADSTAMALYADRAFEAMLEVVATAPDPLHQDTLTCAAFAADALGSVHAARVVLDRIAQDIGEPEDVTWFPPFASETVDRLRMKADQRGPLGWGEWFDVVQRHELKADDLDAVAEWDPLPAPVLIDNLQRLDDPTPLVDVVGRLLAAHRPHLGPSERSEVASTLLTAIALSERRSASFRAAVRTLVEDFLDGEPDEQEVAELLATIEEVFDSQLTAGTIGWALDILGELVEVASATTRDVVATFAMKFVDRLRPLVTSLSSPDRAALSNALEVIGLELPPDIVARFEAESEVEPLDCLRGKRVLIYSLRERAARRAAGVVRSIGGGTEVELSHDHVGSPQLRQLASNADLSLIVTAAAKHAATEFIETHATGVRIPVNTTGTSGILRALEEYCVQASVRP